MAAVDVVTVIASVAFARALVWRLGGWRQLPSVAIRPGLWALQQWEQASAKRRRRDPSLARLVGRLTLAHLQLLAARHRPRRVPRGPLH